MIKSIFDVVIIRNVTQNVQIKQKSTQTEGSMMNRKGFTLVELMVVIVIIGILAAVAIPRMMSAADRARAAEGPSTLSAISQALHVYQTNNATFVVEDNSGSAVTEGSPEYWAQLGISAPSSRNFVFEVADADSSTFELTAAIVGATLGAAAQGGVLILTGEASGPDVRTIEEGRDEGAVQRLVPNWR